MKKFFIVVLLLALCAAAYYTKPRDPKTSFTNYLVDRTSQRDAIIPASWSSVVATSFADQCEYKDRLLWVDVKYKDQTVYSGAFAHWMNRAELKKEWQTDVEKAKEHLDHALDKVAGK